MSVFHRHNYKHRFGPNLSGGDPTFCAGGARASHGPSLSPAGASWAGFLSGTGLIGLHQPLRRANGAIDRESRPARSRPRPHTTILVIDALPSDWKGFGSVAPSYYKQFQGVLLDSAGRRTAVTRLSFAVTRNSRCVPLKQADERIKLAWSLELERGRSVFSAEGVLPRRRAQQALAP